MTGMLQTLFKLEKDEIKPAGMMFLIAFLWGTSQMFSYAAANAIFLNVFGASYLSYTFIFNALLIPLTGIAIMKAAERYSFRQRFIGTILFFVICLSALFILLSFARLEWPAMAYMLWLDIEFAVSSVLFMSLFNKLFNIRQSKRLFGPVGLGTDLSYIMMGFVIAVIVGMTGALNLTLFAIGFDLVSIIVFIWLSVSFPDKIGKSDIIIRDDNEPAERVTLKSLFRKRIIVLIIAMGSIFSVCFCFGTNLYLAQTERFLHDEDRIASFIALFYSVSSIVLLFVKGFLAPRIIKSFGMTVSLLITPVLVGASALVFAVLLRAPIPPLMVFILVVNIYLMQTVLGTSIHKSSFFSLLQSLRPGETDKVINLSETIVPHLINGIAGAALLIMMQVLNAGPQELGIGILIIAGVWVLIALGAGREYRKTIGDIVKNRFGMHAEIALDNPEIMESILSGLRSRFPQEVLYCIQTLENAGLPDLKPRVRELARSEIPGVRRRVYDVFARQGNPDDLGFLLGCLRAEEEPANTAALLNAVANSSEGSEIDRIESYLNDGNDVVSIAAYTALIRHCGIEGVMRAGSGLLGKAASPKARDREFVAKTIGNIGSPNLYNLLVPLMRDDDPDVRREACDAAGKLMNSKLVPFIIKNLDDDASRREAMRGLISFSNAAFPALEELYLRDPSRRKLIAYLYGRIKGEEAVRNLCRKLDEADLDVLSEILTSLELCSFRMDRKDMEGFEKLLERVIDFGVLLWRARKDVGKGLIADALASEIDKNKKRIFSLMLILHPDSNIKDIRFNYFHGRDRDRNALGIELLDNILPKKYKLPVLGILEDRDAQPSPARRESLVMPRSREERIDAIIKDKSTWQNCWLRAAAYYARLEGITSVEERKAFLRGMLGSEDSRVSELILPYRNQDGEKRPAIIRTIKAIRESGIFAGIEDESLVEIAKCLKIARYGANSRVFSKGDEGAQLYILAEGRVRIHDGARQIAELKAGEVFGELSAFSPERRSADATAINDAVLFSVSQGDIFRIIDDRVEVAIDIIGILCARLRTTLEGGDYESLALADHAAAPVRERPTEERRLTAIEKVMVLRTVSIFSKMPDAALNDLADLAIQRDVPAGDILFRKGDAGTSMAVIVSGKMRIHDGEKTIAVLEDREIIGELAALSSESRTATATAVEDTVVLALTQEVVHEMLWDQRDIAKELIKVLVERLRNKI